MTSSTTSGGGPSAPLPVSPESSSSKLKALEGQAATEFNQAGRKTVGKNRTTQVNASRSGYVIVPAAGVDTPPVGKKFQKAAHKEELLSSPELTLELKPPGVAGGKAAKPSTAEKIDGSKIPLLIKKEQIIQEFASRMAKKKDKSKSQDKGGQSH